MLFLKKFIPFAFILSIISLVNCFLSKTGNALLQADFDTAVSSNLHLLRRDIVKQGCAVNVVFLLQGDMFIGADEFQAQKDFIRLVVRTIIDIDESAFFSITQHKVSRPTISTSMGLEQFLYALENSRQSRDHGYNFLNAFGYAAFQLRVFKGEANKIIILGNYPGKSGFRASLFGKRIRQEGIQIGAIAVEHSSKSFWEPITGDDGFVLKVETFFDLNTTVVNIVNKICGFS